MANNTQGKITLDKQHILASNWVNYSMGQRGTDRSNYNRYLPQLMEETYYPWRGGKEPY